MLLTRCVCVCVCVCVCHSVTEGLVVPEKETRMVVSVSTKLMNRIKWVSASVCVPTYIIPTAMRMRVCT